jgi:hypothetical protein
MVLLQFTTLVVVVVEHTVVDKVVVEDKVVVVKEINYMNLNQVQHNQDNQELLIEVEEVVVVPLQILEFHQQLVQVVKVL